jgi:hypothetical protein
VHCLLDPLVGEVRRAGCDVRLTGEVKPRCPAVGLHAARCSDHGGTAPATKRNTAWRFFFRADLQASTLRKLCGLSESKARKCIVDHSPRCAATDIRLTAAELRSNSGSGFASCWYGEAVFRLADITTLELRPRSDSL